VDGLKLANDVSYAVNLHLHSLYVISPLHSCCILMITMNTTLCLKNNDSDVRHYNFDANKF